MLSATFRVTEPWAFQCSPRWVDLSRTNNFTSSTTWSSKPKALDMMGDRNVSAGRGSSCDPDQPSAPIDFRDNPEETNENLTPTVKDFAAGKFAKLTLELRAHDEGDTAAWKRFRNDAVLAVDYVGLRRSRPASASWSVRARSVRPRSRRLRSSPTPRPPWRPSRRPSRAASPGRCCGRRWTSTRRTPTAPGRTPSPPWNGRRPDTSPTTPR
ncbi:hypothetical protein ACFQX6_25920 [Streptosporangium lutulentum]